MPVEEFRKLGSKLRVVRILVAKHIPWIPILQDQRFRASDGHPKKEGVLSQMLQ